MLTKSFTGLLAEIILSDTQDTQNAFEVIGKIPLISMLLIVILNYQVSHILFCAGLFLKILPGDPSKKFSFVFST